MKIREFLRFCVLALAVALFGCSSQAVRCDGKLTPINMPAPSKHGEQVPAEPEP